MTVYARRTSVPIERSKTEIEGMLRRYGADQFMYGWESARAVVQFRAQGRIVKMSLSFPEIPERGNTSSAQRTEKERRRRWRSLGLVIKAKLESIDSGIATFDEEFLPWVVLPDGSTVGDHVLPQLANTYRTGEMPKLLPAPSL